MSKNKTITDKQIQKTLDDAVTLARKNSEGAVASYIPELASVEPELTTAVITLLDGKQFIAGDLDEQMITLQSVAKLIVLIGLLEELGPEKVYKWVKVEPSGSDFASIARLDLFGPTPSNPMLNSGAISLCARIPGKSEDQIHWLENWSEKLFGEKLQINAKVFSSEKRTGERNRSLGYLLKSTGSIKGDVDEILETYFALCSLEANPLQASKLPALLANSGKDSSGKEIISKQMAGQVLSIMATCGLYNETGTHMVRTGMPAKSSVSGYILATVPGIAGIATASPRVNKRGTSLRGEIILEHLANELNWHFAR